MSTLDWGDEQSEATQTVASVWDFCITCEAFGKLERSAVEFAGHMGDILSVGLWSLWIALVGLWVLFESYQICTSQRAPGQTIQAFVYFAISGLLLGGTGGNLFVGGLEAALATMSELAALVFEASDKGVVTTAKDGVEAIGSSLDAKSYEGIQLLLWTAEHSMGAVLNALVAILGGAGAFNPVAYILALLLGLPYFLLLIGYLAQVIVAMFRLTMLAVFAPFAAMAFSFQSTRIVATTTIASTISTIVVLFAATAAFSFAIYGVVSLDLNAEGGVQIWDADFLVAIMIGIAGTALMTEGVGLANSLMNTAFTNTSAGIMTAGALGAAGVAAKVGFAATGGVPGALVQAYGAAKAPSATFDHYKADLLRRATTFVADRAPGLR